MGLISAYNSLPWLVQATTPVVTLSGVLLTLHHILRFNLMEFLGVIFSLLTCISLLVSLVRWLYRNWLGILLRHNTDSKSLGSWAVVTGATAGIGRAYAFALARQGLNLVLLSRSHDKLLQVSEELQKLHKVNVKVIAVDFTGGKEIYDGIRKELRHLEVGLLVNNVATCYPYPEYFVDLPNTVDFCQDMVHCNVLSVTLMTSIVLPGMIERKKGAVVNVGSMSSILCCPFMSLYGATKAFVNKFTQDMEREYRDHNIIFQVVLPGYVASNMSKLKKSVFVASPEEFVEDALKSIGLQSSTAVWLPHQLFHLILIIGNTFRKEGSLFVSHLFSKRLWFYGKKVMMSRNKSRGTMDIN